ncbi:MAG: hypothetical protein AAF236_07885 [Verrucomicrobiota bacterium]
MAQARQDKTDELIFRWAKDKRLWLHLSLFFGVSILLHGAGFYLFQVVYPAPVRIEPEPEQVRLLVIEGNTEVRQMLKKVQDRIVHLQPPSQKTSVRVQLADHRLPFSPIKDRRTPPLRVPPDPESLVQPFDLEAGPVTGEVAIRLVVDENLESRRVAPWSVLSDYLDLAPQLPSVQIEVAVSEAGEVEVQRITPDLGPDGESAFRSIVESTLRFEPGGAETVGWIAIEGTP